jgi:phage terminase large subunit-like protein
MGRSLKEKISLLSRQEQEEFLDGLDREALEAIAREEWFWVQRPEQVPPEGDWSTHIFMGGRGTGKTRSGSEWLVQRTLDYPFDSSGFPTERMVMAYNLSDCRTTCIEGPSGILRVLYRLGFEEVTTLKSNFSAKGKFHYTKSPKPHITLLETEAKIHFTGADPDAPRGFNLADVWLDEIVKWMDARQVWREGIRPALRADIPGDKPRAFVTTTPKPILLLQEWAADTSGRISIARGSTFDNAANLSRDVLEELRSMYEGTTLGRQELYGELLDVLEGALFTWSSIENNRVDIGPEHIAHRAVGVDPGLTGKEDADEMGVVVACRDWRNHIYVVADETVRLASHDAALHAWKVFANYECETLVIENNLGKAWMHQVMLDAFRELQRAGLFPIEIVRPPLVPVHSNYGKKIRAQPIANRYAQGTIHHIGHFDKLESQMMLFDPLTSKHNSPDRMDALVHVCQHLIEGESKRTRIISPLGHEAQHLTVPKLGDPGSYW